MRKHLFPDSPECCELERKGWMLERITAEIDALGERIKLINGAPFLDRETHKQLSELVARRNKAVWNENAGGMLIWRGVEVGILEDKEQLNGTAN